MPSHASPADLTAMLEAAAPHDPADTRISISSGLGDWLLAEGLSLAFTSYQTGQLILAGVGPDGRVAFNEQNYPRATGLHYADGRLFVASMFQLWRLENMLAPGQYANGAFDMVLVPRQSQTINYVDAHELTVDADGRTLFVNTRYSCLATIDDRLSFRPLWRPSFISALAPEDRCHLNGVAMNHGRPAFVSAAAASDLKDGWREHRADGGVLIDISSSEIVVGGLSMPHSPRLHDGSLWVLDSGRGRIATVDPNDGRVETVVFCPGFLRGLAFHRHYAIVTVSKARDGHFRGLALAQELEARRASPCCGVLIIDLRRGEIVESILFDGRVTEMFDVALLPGVRNPTSLGPATVEMIGTVAFQA